MDIIVSSYAAERVGDAGVNRMFSKRTVLNEAMIRRCSMIGVFLLAPIATAAVPAHDELPEMRTLCLECSIDTSSRGGTQPPLAIGQERCLATAYTMPVAPGYYGFAGRMWPCQA